MCALVALAALGPLSACDARGSESAAALVPNEDVRRLSPARKAALPDVMVQAADRARVIGDEQARVQLYVISDYQCAECRRWYATTLPEIRRLYVDSGTVRLSWVHYPLRAHPNAVRAASAALCAGAQGNDMFWAASAQLFEEQARWTDAREPARVIDSLVAATGVEPFALKSCTESGRLLRQVRADIDWTRRLTGDLSLASLRTVLDSAVAATR
jgi:protein-disulfide isomerase